MDKLAKLSFTFVFSKLLKLCVDPNLDSNDIV